jgi:hypothetical protein
MISSLSREKYKKTKSEIRQTAKFWLSEIAVKGQISLLKWAKENGCPWGKVVPHRIALWGNLETLKWVRSETNGVGVCPWRFGVTVVAAICGKMDIMRWAAENGCPLLISTFYQIMDHGSLEDLRWWKSKSLILYQYYEGEDGLDRLYKVHQDFSPIETFYPACENGRVDMAEWIFQNSVLDMSEESQRFCMYRTIQMDGGHLEMLKWLRAQDPPFQWCERMHIRAAKQGHLDVLKWLKTSYEEGEKGYPFWDESVVLELALRRKYQKLTIGHGGKYQEIIDWVNLIPK